MPKDYFGPSIAAFSGQCTACGAGLHNGHKHDDDCLLNLSAHTPQLITLWKQGWSWRVRMGRMPTDNPTCVYAGSKQADAYWMGARMADKMLERQMSAGRTTQSLKEAVQIAQKL